MMIKRKSERDKIERGFNYKKSAKLVFGEINKNIEISSTMK